MDRRAGTWASIVLLFTSGCLGASIPDLPSERSFRLASPPPPWRAILGGEYAADHRLLGQPVPFAFADSTWVRVVATGLPLLPPPFEYHAWTIDEAGKARFIGVLDLDEGSQWRGAGVLAPKESWPRVYVTLQAHGHPLVGIILMAPGSGAASVMSATGELNGLPTFQFARGWVNLTATGDGWDARLEAHRDLAYHCHGTLLFFCQHEALGFAHCAWAQRADVGSAEPARLGCWPVEERGSVDLSGENGFGTLRFFVTVEDLRGGLITVPGPFVALEETLCEDAHGTITNHCGQA